MVEVLKERTKNLELQLEERTKDYHTAMDVNRRLQSEVKQVIAIAKGYKDATCLSLRQVPYMNTNKTILFLRSMKNANH